MHPALRALLLLLACLTAPGFAAEPVTLYYHERPPYARSTTPNQATGFTATPAEIAFRSAGIAFRWELLPAKRQISVIEENQERACMLGWFSNPERQRLGRFTLPIYQDLPMLILARATAPGLPAGKVQVADVLGNKQLKALLKDSYSYGEYLDRLIASHAPERQITVAENDAMLSMLIHKRADYMFMAEEEASELITRLNVSPQDIRLIRPSDMPPGNTRHLWCTLRVEAKLVDALNAAIRRKPPRN